MKRHTAVGEDMFSGSLFYQRKQDLRSPVSSVSMPDSLVQMRIIYEETEDRGLYRE
nr:hypothetical protein [Clostridium sp. AM30-24]